MRSAAQVVASAADMQACLDEGLPREALLALVLARAALRGRGRWPDPRQLEEALRHPAAGRFDQVAIAAIRKEMRR